MNYVVPAIVTIALLLGIVGLAIVLPALSTTTFASAAPIDTGTTGLIGMNVVIGVLVLALGIVFVVALFVFRR